MSSFRNGEIKLDKPKAIFYSGQLVSGSVSFELSAPLTFTAIDVVCLGQADVRWTENIKEIVYGQKRVKEVEYKANEEYMKFSQCLSGGRGVTQLPQGRHNFPFKFNIPHTAPSTFEGDVGSVSYCLTSTIYFPDPNVMQEALVKEFKVVAPMDLNAASPDVKNPINLEFEEVYGCDCICSPAPMNIQVKVPVAGFCPGQNIPITIELDNSSSTEINKMKFEIVCRERYRSHHLPGEFVPPEDIVTRVKRGAVVGKTKKCIVVDLQVPDILPVNLANCTIIDIGYFLRVTFKLSGCNEDLKDEVEIYLGLVPLKEFNKGYVNPMVEDLPEGPVPNPNDPVPFVPTQPGFVTVPDNTVMKNNVTPANNMPYNSNTAYPGNYPTSGYPHPPNSYPAQPNTYPSGPNPYPAQPNPYPVPLSPNNPNNSRPTSGSYGFIAPGYPHPIGGGYPPNNFTGPGDNLPTAPPPYS